ncbi:MAG: hypothetical protein RIR57_1432 [Bacteroidota bacterium]
MEFTNKICLSLNFGIYRKPDNGKRYQLLARHE